MELNSFESRHIGTSHEDKSAMLRVIGVSSIEELIDQTVPAKIRLKEELNLPSGLAEHDYAAHIAGLGEKNKVFKSYIGQGYYNSHTPAVIQRNILENPGWYTAYTPYQAEISQGRLEALLNFQTVVSDFTGLPIANASLLDEATACAEAMIMFYNTRSREQVKAGVNKFLVSDKCFIQTIDVLKNRADALDIELIHGAIDELSFEGAFGVLSQYGDRNGNIETLQPLVDRAHNTGCKIAVACDLLSLALFKAPGEFGVDVAVGTTQRFGVPMGYGGPHAAFFATTEDYKRNVPGRIIGVSVDASGNRALRMALQTREQHIRRDKATSNICTAQALLAIMAGMYAVYHGPNGIKKIASDVQSLAQTLQHELEQLGYTTPNTNFFDTVCIIGAETEAIRAAALDAEINFNYSENRITISVDETTKLEDIQVILDIFAQAKGISTASAQINLCAIDTELQRTSSFLTNEVFTSYHSESEMMRYLKSLENKDISLTHSMISLGSCTMKLNAASELYPITNPNFANIHPFVPVDQAAGYQEMIASLDKWLCEITGFDSMSFQPNSGAQGEYAGLMVIRAFHHANNEQQRKVALIPASAHGTNPASAVMAGMSIKVVKCDENGNIDFEDLKAKAEECKDTLSCLMVTYPSTHGVYEEGINEITDVIHANGGLVYMDGANMNAQVGLTNPANIGADVCHLNLHKTFAIPHGGGGPGMGPIGVVAKLAPFLPSHSYVKTGGTNPIDPIAAAPYSSSLILLISYGYVMMLGQEGLKNSTTNAILNANYIKERLKDAYNVLYKGNHDRIAHEMILECRNFKATSKVEVEDIAKRLIDYGFHAPTVSFPVAGTLMIEPTESESKKELDRFCDAMIAIRGEILDIEKGVMDETSNTLKNAPHTTADLVSDWPYTYSRERAVFPIKSAKDKKYWPPVKRIDNAHGDRNLICTCPSIADYALEMA